MSQLATHEGTSSGETRESQVGFRASITCASLPDLVQMECLAQSSAVFRVTSNSSVGYLYFRDGQLVHASSGDLIGEAAALEILKWRQGTFDACPIELPEIASIHTNWQHLLLRAAQTRDESGRHNLVSFPKPRGPEKLAVDESRKPPPPEMTRSMPTPKPAATPAVRLDPRGTVLSSRGDVTDFAPVVAYVARLGQLIGADLGMDTLVSVECVSRDNRCLMHVEKSGQILAVKASSQADVTSLRNRFGL